MTASQIDRLGERLRKGPITDADLRLLDEFRSSFAEPFQKVRTTIHGQLAIEPSARPEKSTQSICEKLRREKNRLSKIQDIAGLRITVPGAPAQNKLVDRLRFMFTSVRVTDRRIVPSSGYRAVHLIVQVDRQSVEIQVRSFLQDFWAFFSEQFSDKFDSTIKYGGGTVEYQNALMKASQSISEFETCELESYDFKRFGCVNFLSESDESFRNEMGRLNANITLKFETMKHDFQCLYDMLSTGGR